jgi:integrase
MLTNLKYKEVKVRRQNSHLLQGDERYTGTVTYSVIGSIDRHPVHLSLGTEEKNVAIRRITKLEKAIAEGSESPLWRELNDSLPPKTFKFFADRVGYVNSQTATSIKPTWQGLCDSFEFEMERLIANKARGVGSEEGVMATSTRDRYRQAIRQFTNFLPDANTTLDAIKPATIELFKVDRQKKIIQLKQSRGGTSVALDVAILHRMFAFAIKKGLMTQKPIDLQNESKPGKNPKNGARPFKADELTKLREAAGSDLFMLLLLRWTGLRGSDAVNLKWDNVHFDRGVNGEIEVLTQKRTKIAIIPLSTELRNALENARRERKAGKDDQVLLNPETGEPFASRARMYERARKIGVRAGVARVTPHCFRDTFACDMLARGASIFDVAKMLADTVDTVEKHYAQFVPAARDAAQSLMDKGIGIEERAKLAQQRGRKVVGIR